MNYTNTPIVNDHLRKLNQDGFYRIIAEVEDYAIILLDKDGFIVSWNKGAEEMTRYSIYEILRQHHRIFCSPEDKAAGRADILLSEAEAAGKASCEGWCLTKDGTKFWSSTHVTAIHNDANEVTGFIKIIKDLTERKTAEDKFNNYAEELAQKNSELLKSEERYHKMVSEVEGYAIILLNTEGNILEWNKGAQKIFGYEADEVSEKKFALFHVEEDRNSSISEHLLADAKLKGSATHEGWLVSKDGRRFWGNITITALHDAQNKVIGFSGFVSDLTQGKMANDRLSSYNESLKQKNLELQRHSERYHRMIAEIANYAFILLDREGKILEWNKGAERLHGYAPEEIKGKSFRLFYPRESKDANVPEQLLNQAVENGSTIHEGWRVRKDGTRFWSNVSITALHDNEGHVIGFSKVTRDLTEKKIADDKLSALADSLIQKNEALRRSEERYHRMIAEVRDYAIILLNTKGDIENWNFGAEHIKGYTAAEIIGKNFSIFYTPEDRARKLPQKLLEEAAKSGRATHEGWRVRKNGSRFWGSIVITALHDSSGRITGFSKVTRDLTEKKKTDDALAENAAQLNYKNKMLEQANSELKSFTYIASHDLKEPLRKIKTFAGLLNENKEMSDVEKNYMKKIDNSVQRMQRLIDDLLAYSLVANEKAQVEPVDLNQIVKAVQNDLEVSITEKHAVIQSDKLPVIKGVSFQLQQLFMNLLSNSLKFSKLSEPPLIVISCKEIQSPDIPNIVGSGNYYLISIKDNGIGFDPIYSSKIFEVFQRLHGQESFSGTGIGLAIVKKVVENHHGIISAESSLNAGATFNIYLPSQAEA
jgi:PAS domain S-box-containing protein